MAPISTTRHLLKKIQRIVLMKRQLKDAELKNGIEKEQKERKRVIYFSFEKKSFLVFLRLFV
jgi:hypothetical protein